MSKLQKRKLERVQYWQGQTLKARDFRDIQAIDAQRRWWHNRALHNAYGPSRGWEASLNDDQAAIEVQPGLAYDCFGRELILQAKQLVPPPAVAPPEAERIQYLIVRYREPQNGCCDEFAGACWGQSKLSLLNTVEFIWKARQDVSPQDGVPIAALLYSGQKIARLRNLLQSQVQPLASPLLVSGSTIPGNTAWDLWQNSDFNDFANGVIGVETTIDTSAAGFTDIPVYFAWLEGSLWNPQMRQLVPALLPSIADEATDSFSFRLWLPVVQEGSAEFAALKPKTSQSPSFTLADASGFSAFARQQNLYVSWIGCQCLSACRSVAKSKTVPSILAPAGKP